jgi:LysM repeat protein
LRLSVAVILLLGGFALSGCGRMLLPPTPTAAPAAAGLAPGLAPSATHTPRPTATRRATFTPVPATPSNTPTPTVTPTPIIYVIKRGDTLIPIARKFGVTVQEIQDANGIVDPGRLSVGQEIVIPVHAQGESGPTIVPTPTPVALAIQGIGFHRTPVDSLWCMGEIVNVSGKPAEEVQIEVSLHDAGGRLLASGTALAALDIIPPGGHSPFAILFTVAPSSFAQYQTRVLAGVPSTHLGPRYPHLSVVDDWGGWLEGDDAGYQVRGEVHNTGPADAEHVTVIVTLYDLEDHVVAARTVEIAANVFMAGARAPFEVTLVPVADVARYDLSVQGWWIGYEPPLPVVTAGATP